MGRHEKERPVEDHEEYNQLMKILDNPGIHQEQILARILSRNAKAAYLLQHKMNGATDVKSFREKVPVSDYDDYKPFVDRILAGDKSPLLAGEPPIEVWTSSGTSKGALKMFPGTNEEIDQRVIVANYNSSILSRFMPDATHCKCLALLVIRQGNILSCGLPSSSISASSLTDPTRTRGVKGLSSTSPQEAITSADDNAGMYCHLLLGLVQREEVGRILTFFPAVFMKAMRCLQEWWPEICDDIANGTLSMSRVKDETLRAAVLARFGKDSDLAELLKKEFSSAASWDGIVPKLWQNIKAVDICCTGSMEPYFDAVSKYAGHVPFISSSLYMSTEGSHGMNLDPKCPANRVRFTIFPSAAYYEFIPVATEDDSSQAKTKPDSGPAEVLDLMSVKEDQEYEILVTTLSGLYRYRIGDILKVVGYYKSNPLFQLLGRASMTLSVDTDKTEEKDLRVALKQGSQILERESGLSIRDFTSTVDFSSKPAHYVIFWELDPSSSSGLAVSAISSNSSESVIAKCCAAMEAALSRIYRRGRFENIIGPLEVRLVQEGTFDLLCEQATSRGTSFAQFKTPRVMTSTSPGLETMNSRVIQSVVSQEKPPYNPTNTVPNLA